MPPKKSSWDVLSTEKFDDWIGPLDDDDQDHIAAALINLQQVGPGIRRPLVGKIEASRHANMRELLAGTLRILFSFDPNRDIILLIGGNKANRWQVWYDEVIPIADDLLDEHLARIKAKSVVPPQAPKGTKRKGKRQ